MINIRFIINLLGKLMLIESACFLLCVLISLLYRENDTLAFLYSTLITGGTGAIMAFGIKANDKVLAKKDGYFTVTFIWLFFSLFGCLPFILGNTIPSFPDAFFETMSGFTTTGSSILNDIEALPHASLFWRSMTQWLGGLGIAVLFLAILPSLGIEGRDLYVAEVPGPTHNKMAATFYSSARKLWLFYLFFTLLEAVLLSIGGMGIFDAICHSYTTMATGGFSTKQDSIAYWNSPYIQYVIIVFMCIAATNFGLFYAALKGDVKKLLLDEEFRWYMILILGATTIIATGLYWANWGEEEKCIRDALFQVVSIMTTTGFATADYLYWPTLLGLILFILMFIGSCASSTAGGIKVIRVVLLFKNSFTEMKRIIHPNAVINVKYNDKSVHPTIMTSVMGFFILFIIVFSIGSVIMAFFTEDIATACSAVITSLSNIGPGFGSLGPMDNFAHLSDVAKLFLAALMLIGRLEVFTVLVLFTKAFWKK